ncbi:hypothetical protein ABT267_51000, partial [Nonomuraea sp. NPDC001023]
PAFPPGAPGGGGGPPPGGLPRPATGPGGLPGGDALAAAAAPWFDRVRHVAATAAADAPAPALLVRPDGYVAWAGAGPDGLRAALARWFGPS